MNKRTFLTLSPWLAVLLIFSANSEEESSSLKNSLRDARSFVVTADWVACYKDNNGIPDTDIKTVFYRGERLQRQQGPAREYGPHLYLPVKYNTVPDQSCFIKATTATISAVNTLPLDSSGTENKSTAAQSNNNSTDKNSAAANDPVIGEGDAALKEATVPANNNAKSFTISCTAPGRSSVRRLETSFANAPSMLPCKVLYYREDGKTQVIADAKYTAGYCAEKRNAFLEKLKSWGWQCE